MQKFLRKRRLPRLPQALEKKIKKFLIIFFSFFYAVEMWKTQISFLFRNIIHVPSDGINDIVRMYWGQAVEIQGIRQQNGVFEMKAIKIAT